MKLIIFAKMKKMSKILRYVIPYWTYAILNIVFNILSALFSLVSLTMIVPFLQLLFGTTKLVTVKPEFSFSSDSLVNNFYYYVSSIITNYGKQEALIFICAMVAILFLIKNLFRYLGMYYIAPIRNGVVKDIRNALFLKVMILPLSYFTEQRKGDIISRMTSDVQEIEWSIMSSLEMIFRDPISMIAFTVTLFILSPQLTLFVLILLPLTALLIGRIGKSLKKTSLKGQVKMGELLSMIEETISGLRIIKAFNAIDSTEQKFQNLNNNYTKIMIRLFRKRDLASPLSEFLGVLVLVIVLLFGGQLVLSSKETISPENFILYIAVFSQLIVPAKSFTQAMYNIQKGIASAERIDQILVAEEKIVEKSDAVSIKKFGSSIEYKNVSFQYEDEPVLININLKIEKGKTIALVGSSGGGKSTMVDLLPRFYDCVGGEILVDGVNVKDYVISDLRGLMGIVTQETILFNDTVFNNIAFGMTDVSEEDVINAAKIANAHDFILELPKGYHTNIADRGSKLSGGQKQRISIARAVLKNPPVMILDEATSSLDTESERLVQDALIKLMQNRTSVVIAHRLSTIQFADEIIVLQKGEIVERGNHNELYDADRVYRKLCDLQSFT
jgi:subfamily B ATP-binding cassette protein MsbA